MNNNQLNINYKSQPIISKTIHSKSWVKSLETCLVGLLLVYFINPPQASPLATAMNAGTYVIISILIICRWKRFLSVATRDISLLLLFIMIGISGFWSVLPEATEITAKAVQRAMLIGVYLSARYTIKAQMQIYSWVLGGVTFLSIFASLTSHNKGAWVGIFLYKNHFAIFMTITAMLFLLNAINNSKRPWIAWIGFAVTTILVFLSQSKSNYLILFISLSLFPLQKLAQQKYKLRVLLLATGLLIVGITLVISFNNMEVIVVDVLGKNLEFNGRTPIWTICIEQGLKRPWFGYGIAGFWGSRESLIIQSATWAGGTFSADEIHRFNSHNGYLEVFLQLGVVGVFLFMWSFISSLIRTISVLISTASIESFWIFQTLIILCLYNCADTAATISRGALWILYISMCFSSHILKKQLSFSSREAI